MANFFPRRTSRWLPVWNDPLNPVALLIAGESFDYTFSKSQTRYFTEGNYKVCKINQDDPGNPPWRTEVLFAQTLYNQDIRADWTMVVDEVWPTESPSTHLVFQAFSVDMAGNLNPNIQIAYSNNEFVCYLCFPQPPSRIAGSFPGGPGTYNLSVRIRPHMTSGKVEVWVNGELKASAYNVQTAYTTSSYWWKYGLYRWKPFSGSMRVLHGPVRTGKFQFLK